MVLFETQGKLGKPRFSHHFAVDSLRELPPFGTDPHHVTSGPHSTPEGASASVDRSAGTVKVEYGKPYYRGNRKEIHGFTDGTTHDKNGNP